jgi:hypothetical protein
MSRILLERILNVFPPSFVSRLVERQFSLYQQSIDQVMSEQPWSDVEAFTLLPYIRRALWESELRKTAIECGLKTFDLSHVGQNSSCVNVKAGGLVLTEHYVSGPSEFVRDAESRKQNSGVNRWLNHYTDQRLLTTPLPKLDEKPIYLNLLHGAVFPTSKKADVKVDAFTCFIRFAIPAADSRQYLAGCNWSAQELLQHYASAPRTATEPAVTVADRAKPVIKKKA